MEKASFFSDTRMATKPPGNPRSSARSTANCTDAARRQERPRGPHASAANRAFRLTEQIRALEHRLGKVETLLGLEKPLKVIRIP